MNKLIQRGNLGGSPVIKTAGEVVYARFSYAVNVLDRDGNRTPQWWPAVAFGKLAQTLGQLQKGDEILIEGEPRETRYTKDGVEHRAFEVRVLRVEFLRLKPRANGDATAAPQEEPAAPDAGEDHSSDPGPEPDVDQQCDSQPGPEPDVDQQSDPQSGPEPHPGDEPPIDPQPAETDQARPRSRWRRAAA
jgi:single-stranded DNA-binding protein